MTGKFGLNKTGTHQHTHTEVYFQKHPKWERAHSTCICATVSKVFEMSALLHAASSSVAGFTWLPQSESWPSPESAVSLPVAPRSSWEVSGPHSHEARSGKRLRDPFAEARLWARGGAAPPSMCYVSKSTRGQLVEKQYLSWVALSFMKTSEDGSLL